MEPGTKIINDNGKTYTAMEMRGPDTLLSYETPHDLHYMIAWRLYQLENKRFIWQQGHYYIENLAGAQRAMITRETERQDKSPCKFIHIR